MDLVELHAPNFRRFTQSFLGEGGDILIGEENGESPYDPLYLTSRTIRQPKLHLRLPGFERVLLEHQ